MSRLVEILNDVTIESNCNREWLVESRDISPLEALANSVDNSAEEYFGTADSQWLFDCRRHNVMFPMGTTCPHTYETYSLGESVVLDDQLAARLVRLGQAAYPRENLPERETGDQANLDRANIMLEQMGLPLLDHETYSVINATTKSGRGTSKHYAKPTDTRLAGELGLSPSDVAEMRKLSGK